MKTNAERQAAKRQRDRDAGIIGVLVKIPASQKPALIEFVKGLNKVLGE